MNPDTRGIDLSAVALGLCCRSCWLSVTGWMIGDGYTSLLWEVNGKRRREMSPLCKRHAGSVFQHCIMIDDNTARNCTGKKNKAVMWGSDSYSHFILHAMTIPCTLVYPDRNKSVHTSLITALNSSEHQERLHTEPCIHKLLVCFSICFASLHCEKQVLQPDIHCQPDTTIRVLFPIFTAVAHLLLKHRHLSREIRNHTNLQCSYT